MGNGVRLTHAAPSQVSTTSPPGSRRRTRSAGRPP